NPPGTSTRSPGVTSSTPGPVSSTIPAASPPGIKGSSRFTWYCPAIISTSTKLTPRARNATLTSPGPGVGDTTSRSTRFSGLPSCSQKIAFILPPSTADTFPGLPPSLTGRGYKQVNGERGTFPIAYAHYVQDN